MQPIHDAPIPDLWEAMRRNYVAYFRLFAPLPGCELHESAQVTWFVSQHSPGQHVLGVHFAETEAEAGIDQVLAELARRTWYTRWLLFDSCRPANLGDLLEARHLRPSVGDPWMLADLDQLPAANFIPAGFRLRRVDTLQTLADWTKLQAVGFHMATETAQIWHDAYALDGWGSDACARHYVGYLNQQPVTCSTLLLAEGVAGIFDVATLPAFRRRGFASAATHLPLQEAQTLGYRYASLQACRDAVPVYEKLGFVTQFYEREYHWRRPILTGPLTLLPPSATIG